MMQFPVRPSTPSFVVPTPIKSGPELQQETFSILEAIDDLLRRYHDQSFSSIGSSDITTTPPPSPTPH
jgi:hypothetical protein